MTDAVPLSTKVYRFRELKNVSIVCSNDMLNSLGPWQPVHLSADPGFSAPRPGQSDTRQIHGATTTAAAPTPAVSQPTHQRASVLGCSVEGRV